MRVAGVLVAKFDAVKKKQKRRRKFYKFGIANLQAIEAAQTSRQRPPHLK